MASKLSTFLERAGQPVLVVVDDVSPWGAAAVPGLAGEHARRPLSSLDGSAADWGTVLLLTPSRAALRSAAAMLPALGSAETIACWLAGGREPLVLAPRPEWPRLRRTAAARADDGFLTEARFAGPVDAADVLRELARQAVAGSVRAESALPAVVRDPVLPPVDELVVNPVGFRKRWREPVAVLAPDGSVALDDAKLDLAGGADDVVVDRLRRVQGVQVEYGEHTPLRAVAALAVAGVPLVGAPPPRAAAVLGDALSAALGEAGDLGDPVWREEHSVLLRRAALDRHSTLARRDVSAEGRAVPRFPTVSVLLATRRPDRLALALEQVAAQRDVDLELVVAAHGFSPDPATVEQAAAGTTTSVLALPADTIFGDVLAAAERAAGGDLLLKVDDDDWYGPDFVRDLLWARRYSGAEVVGVPSEYVYLADKDVTIRRRMGSEVFSDWVAGGTLMIERDLFREVGGFPPVRRSVDAHLLAAVAATGAVVYRGHALGYLMRRGHPSEHTWQQESSYFELDRQLLDRWPGFRPSRILRQGGAAR